MTTTRTQRVTCTIETTSSGTQWIFSDGLMSVFVKDGRKKNMSNVLYHCTVIVGTVCIITYDYRRCYSKLKTNTVTHNTSRPRHCIHNANTP